MHTDSIGWFQRYINWFTYLPSLRSSSPILLSYLFTFLLVYFLTYLSTSSRIDPFVSRPEVIGGCKTLTPTVNYIQLRAMRNGVSSPPCPLKSGHENWCSVEPKNLRSRLLKYTEENTAAVMLTRRRHLTKVFHQVIYWGMHRLYPSSELTPVVAAFKRRSAGLFSHSSVVFRPCNSRLQQCDFRFWLIF